MKLLLFVICVITMALLLCVITLSLLFAYSKGNDCTEIDVNISEENVISVKTKIEHNFNLKKCDKSFYQLYHNKKENMEEDITKEEKNYPYESISKQNVITATETIKTDDISYVPVLTEYDEDYISQKIEELRSLYPDGMYWNNGGVTTTPCNHRYNGCTTCNIYKGVINNAFPYKVVGRQCLGFASMCSDYIFGINAPTNVFSDYESLTVGDFIRINNTEHAVLVIEKNDKYISVVECNNDYKSCIISWDRRITKEYLEENNSWYIKRYYDNISNTGSNQGSGSTSSSRSNSSTTGGNENADKIKDSVPLQPSQNTDKEAGEEYEPETYPSEEEETAKNPSETPSTEENTYETDVADKNPADTKDELEENTTVDVNVNDKESEKLTGVNRK